MLLAFLLTWDQHIAQWAASLGAPTEALFRLSLAAIAGGLIGLERELRGRQAGFRTNLLVCMGSALVILVSSQLALHSWQPANSQYTIRVDPGRIAYGVMTGIGFIGAGVIVHQKAGSVRGLTTAAGLWCVAAVGLTAGFGMYVVSMLATMLILTALWVLDYFEDMLPKYRYRRMTVRMKWHPGCIAATVEKFRRSGLRVFDASFERSPDLLFADIHVNIAFRKSSDYYELERQIEEDPEYQLLAAAVL
jgi:putative Mg2+ transporter-C (MgtC) family protein